MNDALKFLTEPMREATKEERESVNNYIKSISERMIPMSVIERIKEDILDLYIDNPKNEEQEYANQTIAMVLARIDKHIKEYTE